MRVVRCAVFVVGCVFIVACFFLLGFLALCVNWFVTSCFSFFLCVRCVLLVARCASMSFFFFVTCVLRVACWLRVMCLFFLFVVCGYAFVVVFVSCCLLFVNVAVCL